jgi:hypothetical protein
MNYKTVIKAVIGLSLMISILGIWKLSSEGLIEAALTTPKPNFTSKDSPNQKIQNQKLTVKWIKLEEPHLKQEQIYEVLTGKIKKPLTEKNKTRTSTKRKESAIKKKELSSPTKSMRGINAGLAITSDYSGLGSFDEYFSLIKTVNARVFIVDDDSNNVLAEVVSMKSQKAFQTKFAEVTFQQQLVRKIIEDSISPEIKDTARKKWGVRDYAFIIFYHPCQQNAIISELKQWLNSMPGEDLSKFAEVKGQYQNSNGLLKYNILYGIKKNGDSIPINRSVNLFKVCT